MPARSPSPALLAALTELGRLDERGIGRLRAHLERVPDPRSRRGRWYPLVSVLPICSCAVVSDARTIEETAEWGRRAAIGLPARMGARRHLPGRYRAPSHPTLTRILAAVDGDALDTAGSAQLVRRHRHLLPAVSHAPATITLARREVGAPAA